MRGMRLSYLIYMITFAAGIQLTYESYHNQYFRRHSPCLPDVRPEEGIRQIPLSCHQHHGYSTSCQKETRPDDSADRVQASSRQYTVL